MLSWTQRGFKVLEVGILEWRELRREIDHSSAALCNFPMINLKLAIEVGPSVLRRVSTNDQLRDFKKLSSFELLGLIGGLTSLVSVLPISI